MPPLLTRFLAPRWHAVAVVAIWLGLAGLIHAQTVPIAGLYATGVSNTNALLGNNASDSHYVVSNIPASAPASNAGISRTVRETSANPLPAGWIANTSTARWITTPGASTAGSGTNTSGGNNASRVNGTFDYTLTFDLPAGGILSSVNISGAGAAGDAAQIFVNGFLISGQATGTFSGASAFTLNSSNASFVSGTNTITFRVNNSGAGATGLIITSLSGSVDVPEVGAWLPILGAIGLYGIMLWRRRQATLTAPGPR